LSDIFSSINSRFLFTNEQNASVIGKIEPIGVNPFAIVRINMNEIKTWCTEYKFYSLVCLPLRDTLAFMRSFTNCPVGVPALTK